MIKDNTKYTIYILELEKGKYYVGRTEHKKNRINDHFVGRGSVFTRKYNPKKFYKRSPIATNSTKINMSLS